MEEGPYNGEESSLQNCFEGRTACRATSQSLGAAAGLGRRLPPPPGRCAPKGSMSPTHSCTFLPPAHVPFLPRVTCPGSQPPNTTHVRLNITYIT